MINYYKTLGLDQGATSTEIRDAFRKLSKKFHPDLNPNDEYFTSLFREIKIAYDTLYNSTTRLKYDSKLDEYLSKDVDLGTYVADIENKIKKDYDIILKQKEEEIKRKFWTEKDFERERKIQELERRKKRNKILEKDLKIEIDKLVYDVNSINKSMKSSDSKIKDLNDKINEEENSIAKKKVEKKEIETQIGELKAKIQELSGNKVPVTNNAELSISLDEEFELISELRTIKNSIPENLLLKFISNWYTYAIKKSVDADFHEKNKDLEKMIISQHFNNNIINEVHKKYRRIVDLDDKLKSQILAKVVEL